MTDQIEKIDITFKDLEAHDVKILASATQMYNFIHEWMDHMREAVKYCTLDEEGYKAIDKLKTNFYQSMGEHGITDLFDQ